MNLITERADMPCIVACMFQSFFGLKLGKSSQKAKSCFLQQLKNNHQSCRALISMAHVANMGENTKRRSPTDQKKSKLKPCPHFGNQS
jgi:hypothetical protein